MFVLEILIKFTTKIKKQLFSASRFYRLTRSFYFTIINWHDCSPTKRQTKKSILNLFISLEITLWKQTL